MTGPDPTVINTAEDSYVGVQVGVVHGDLHYMVPPGASPEQKFRVGVRFLDGNVPSRGRELIHEAVMAEYHTDEVCFYWLLSLVSGRTWNELSDDEVAILKNKHRVIGLTGDDGWTAGVRMIDRLLDFAENPENDLHALLAEFDKLDDAQRTPILKHLEMFLDGPLQDRMWELALAQAERDQTAGDRADRVWMFFQPDPAEPRPRAVADAEIPVATWIHVVAATAVFVGATVHLGYLLARAGHVSALLVYVLSLLAGHVGAGSGMDWRFRVVRRRAKDAEYGGSRHRRNSAPAGGFARRVDDRFAHYFARYVPRGMDRQVWLAETAGVRQSIRDEIVETFREQRTGAERLHWLIRHRVRDVGDRWQNGTLRSYRTDLATPLTTRFTAILGLALLAAGWTWAVGDAVADSPLSAARSAAVALIGACVAARARLHITLESRRAVHDRLESRRTLEGDRAAYDRWRKRLAGKPGDAEMAAWLDCDRKMLLSEALRHYRLTMKSVIAYAFVETRAASSKRARIKRGPWRYEGYDFLVFLLTADGVRQLTARLDFAHGSFHDRHRTNYRYEAVAAVRVGQADDDRRTFELSLVNGQEIEVQVMDPGMEQLEDGESLGEVSRATLDAAGFQHTLHVLEGIAAEGKRWIARESQRGKARARTFADTMRDPES
ncbi:hypothetical protein [Actinomadura sp. DC4]|uniref:hypothetical protein n=1 Tax=Actinomadura sp. DC4 TaxID=3055069 RepID=UPI0025B0773A|nr:hypothetical protein [Actinomadura sp. DC4]MDN3357918.1 hypothetical protein [Actinomadura sp. DC4]